MHEPRPYGRFSYGVDLSPQDEAAAESLVRHLTNLKAAGQLPGLKMVRQLPGGATAIAQDAGGLLRLIIQPAPQEKHVATDGLAKDYIPMLFCGEISQGVVEPGQGVQLHITDQTRRRLVSYDPEANLPPAKVSLQRFVIEHGESFSELRPKQPPKMIWTQYANQRPTWYSGAMAEAVQIVGGYGRQRLGELPDDPVERARVTLPFEVARRIQEELGNVRLPGYTGLPVDTGQFRFEYKFYGTHGVSFDSAGKPWLVEVGNRGVYAMPMPMIPATTTQAFRQYVEQVGDDELVTILDRFGGLPSGEAFPLGGGVFEIWRRAGVIIKVCDTADFYDMRPYSTACGWSFNLRGTEGFNTCYTYQENGIKVGLAFKLSLALGPAENAGLVPDEWNMDDPHDQRRLNEYLAAIHRATTENTPKNLAIKYKLRRADPQALLARHIRSPEEELDYWDAFESEPIATHSGNVARVAAGPLYHYEKFENQPQIKFPEPTMDGCVSFDFSPLDPSVVPSGYIVKCDTIMFGWYVGNDLKVAKYFLDTAQYAGDVESDFEDCMTVGSWTETVTSGIVSLQGNFYTSDFDEREAYASTVQVTRIKGEDMGFDSTPHFSFDFAFYRTGSLWRYRYFKRTTDVTKSEGRGMVVALCVPYLERNAILHAKKAWESGSLKTHSVVRMKVQDPTTYRYWTHDHVFAWKDALPVMNGEPFPKDGNPVWVEIENYNPGQCSDFADQGPWIPGLPYDYTWLIHPSRYEWQHSGGGGAPPLNEVLTTEVGDSKILGSLSISIIETPETVHSDVPDQGYFEASPNAGGGVFYRDAVANAAGTAIYASVSEFLGGKQRKFFGYTVMADHLAAHHFIGVING